MTKKEKIIIVVLSILSGIGVLESVKFLFLEHVIKNAKDGGISIIGGSDGPTSVFLMTNVGTGVNPVYIITVILLAVTSCYYISKKRKHK